MKRNKPYMRDDDDAPKEPAKSFTDCLVFGCPLPGVFGERGSRASFCCVHDGKKPEKWPEITTRIRNREELFHVAMAMTNELVGTDVSDSLVERVVALGGWKPAPPVRALDHFPGRITVRSYGAQIRSSLIAHCRGQDA